MEFWIGIMEGCPVYTKQTRENVLRALYKDFKDVRYMGVNEYVVSGQFTFVIRRVIEG